jgi:hypothetical protein
MSNSHGELFTEIGRLVLAANCGEAIDLGVTAKDLATRYQNLGISEETIAKVVSRSIGAVSLSLARAAPLLMTPPEATEGSAPSDPDDGPSAPAETIVQAAPKNGGRRGGRRSKSKAVPAAANGAGDVAASKKSLFPSGVRLAVLT